jgi:hypothetical protein
MKYYIVYILQVRNNQESPVLSSNDCFIKEPSFSTRLGFDGFIVGYYSFVIVQNYINICGFYSIFNDTILSQF